MKTVGNSIVSIGTQRPDSAAHSPTLNSDRRTEPFLRCVAFRLLLALLVFLVAEPSRQAGAAPPRTSIRISEVEICWNSVPNITYRVESAPAPGGPWTTVRSGIPSAGTLSCITDPIARGQPRSFYRVIDVSPVSLVTVPGPLPLMPTSDWIETHGVVAPACSPPNPMEVAFMGATSPSGSAVRLETASTRSDCCECSRRTKRFCLRNGTASTANLRLEGYFATTRGANDPFSIASMQIDLWRGGVLVGSRLYAAENRPNNNCAGSSQLPEVLLTSGAAFVIPLSSIATNADFDETQVHLQGYGCDVATNTITLGNLQVTLAPPPLPPLPLQPASSWVKDTGENSGGACTPLNPAEVNFIDTTAGGGNAVKLETISTTVSCCSCTRRSKSFPLGQVLNAANVRLAGWFRATRGAGDVFSVASLQIDLYRAGQRVGLRTFAAENRTVNNCSSGLNQLPETLLTSGANFVIPLSTIAGGISFDELRVRLQGYGCGAASNQITLSNLRLTP